MSKIEFKLLSSDYWQDFEELFGKNGADGGCWCMFFRLTSKQFSANGNSGNKKEMKLLVDNDMEPGILAYVDGVPAGWCSLGPKNNFPRLNRSPITKKFDDEEVWSIVCFFIHRNYRKQGLSEELLRYAINYAKNRGAKILEGYPRDSNSYSDSHMFVGVYGTFLKLGFKEMIRRKAHRPLMRYFFD